MKVTVTGVVRHLCPYVDEVDHGEVELTFHVADGDGPELHSLAHRLRDYEDERISHEAFTRTLLDVTDAERVVTRWTTAGLAVTCEANRE